VLMVECPIIGEYSDCTSKHGKTFEGGGRCLYKEMLFCVGEYHFPLSLQVVPLYCKA